VTPAIRKRGRRCRLVAGILAGLFVGQVVAESADGQFRLRGIPVPPQGAANRRTWVIARVRALDNPKTSPEDRFKEVAALRESYCLLSPLYQSYAPALKSVGHLRKDRGSLAGMLAGIFTEELRIGLDPSKTDAEKRTLLARSACRELPPQ
jgi:hypothetical protein